MIYNHQFNYKKIRLYFAFCLINFFIIYSYPAQAEKQQPLLYGLCYSPFRNGQSPNLGIHPSRNEIIEDLTHLKKFTHRIRLYGLTGSGRIVIEEASRLGFQIFAGLWLSKDMAANEREINLAIKLAKLQLKGLEGFIVGSEVLMRGGLPPDALIQIIQDVKSSTNYPVAYAAFEQFWLKNHSDNLRISKVVDHIIVHIYPYWMGHSIKEAPLIFDRTLNQIRDRFPNKAIIVGETGWPSAGETYKKAVPSEINQAKWLQYIMTRSYQDQIYFFSAFSENWKTREEGVSGSNWGLFKNNGKPHLNFATILRSLNYKNTDLNINRVGNKYDLSTNGLWEAYNQSDFHGVVVTAEKIISRDAGVASLQQQIRANIANNDYDNNPQLNTVGLAYFLMGQSWLQRNNKVKARQAFVTILNKYNQAMAWNQKGFYWSIADSAQEQLSLLTVMKNAKKNEPFFKLCNGWFISINCKDLVTKPLDKYSVSVPR